MKISVIICTHNPRKDHLDQTIKGLRNQTLPMNEWELLLVDNASDQPVIDRWQLDWHSNGHNIVEPELGLTPARMRGIHESKANLLVYVDDDLILSPDYLVESLKIAKEYPYLGIWGGNLEGGFEVEPPESIIPYLEMLAVRKVNKIRWSNLQLWETTPSGAGMVVRKNVAERYAEETKKSGLKKFLSRKGTSLSSGGEIDVAYTAIDMGYGCGLFPQLSATHLLPKERLQESYILRLQEGIYFSGVLIAKIRGNDPKPSKKPRLAFMRKIYHYLFGNFFGYQMSEAKIRAEERAERIYREIEKNSKEGLWKLRSLQL